MITIDKYDKHGKFTENEMLMLIPLLHSAEVLLLFNCSSSHNIRPHDNSVITSPYPQLFNESQTDDAFKWEKQIKMIGNSWKFLFQGVRSCSHLVGDVHRGVAAVQNHHQLLHLSLKRSRFHGGWQLHPCLLVHNSCTSQHLGVAIAKIVLVMSPVHSRKNTDS